MVEIILGIFFTEKFGFVMSKMLYLIGDYFGWWINLLAVFSVILGMVLIIFKWGDVKIGGIDAKPDFTTWQWYSISICGGIGCGLLYWAMGEPLYHFPCIGPYRFLRNSVKPPGKFLSVMESQNQVVGNGKWEHQPILVPVLGNERDPLFLPLFDGFPRDVRILIGDRS